MAVSKGKRKKIKKRFAYGSQGTKRASKLQVELKEVGRPQNDFIPSVNMVHNPNLDSKDYSLTMSLDSMVRHLKGKWFMKWSSDPRGFDNMKCCAF